MNIRFESGEDDGPVQISLFSTLLQAEGALVMRRGPGSRGAVSGEPAVPGR